MAPKPVVTKKSSLVISSLATSRQGKRQIRTQNSQRAEGDPSGHSPRNVQVDSERANSIDEEVPSSSSSQCADQAGLQQLIGNVVDKQRKREANRKDEVYKSYDESFKSVERSIHGLFNKHEEKASSIHQAQLKQLRDLVAQKARIEAAMQQELASLQTEYDAHSKDLRSCIDRRIKELQ
ncbi:hypothetical protein ACN47E_005029 [Coniothyrium glycines]